jgi:hypothetical protein
MLFACTRLLLTVQSFTKYLLQRLILLFESAHLLLTMQCHVLNINYRAYYYCLNVHVYYWPWDVMDWIFITALIIAVRMCTSIIDYVMSFTKYLFPRILLMFKCTRLLLTMQCHSLNIYYREYYWCLNVHVYYWLCNVIHLIFITANIIDV